MRSRKVVGRAMRETPQAGIAVEAPRMAIERRRPPPGPIRHSDRGVRYAADACRQVLAAAGTTPSPPVVRTRTPDGRRMSRRGNRLDNAPMESFFHTLKVERVHHRVHPARDAARRDLFGYIEGFDSSRRPHSAPGHRSPADIGRMAA